MIISMPELPLAARFFRSCDLLNYSAEMLTSLFILTINYAQSFN
ncbi:hypothetical protein SBA5_70116 [Candidatus Sulfotelmatomonas gaucii]|uniref:Uncharacterized protein n=1 Tax=Candidatus Sulfuritelmatomonas gaucii TaxID=2043161 RepID=A0A2N9M0M7_9BACT|nr:hypothetical protein SBA5_70116 [Candidatus Sulfotelmatomonas gaucii]